MKTKTSKENLVPVLNKNDHLVYVKPETLKGPHSKDFKPAPKDKGHDAHRSEHHESTPQIVKDNFHAKPAKEGDKEAWQAEAKKGVKSPECQKMLDSMTDGRLFNAYGDKYIDGEALKNYSDEEMETVADRMAQGAVVGAATTYAAASWATFAVVGKGVGAGFVVSAGAPLLAAGAAVGALMMWKSSIKQKREEGTVKRGAASLKAEMERAMHSPTMKDLENAAHITDGKGHVDKAKVVAVLKETRDSLKKTSSLRAQAIRLAYENPELRPHLLPLIQKAADQGEEEEAPSSPSKKPGGKFIEFMKEMGDEKVRNPDTGNDAKLKSLKGDKGRKLQHEKFEKWLASQEKSKGKSDEKGGKPPAKSEGTKDKGPDKPSGSGGKSNPRLKHEDMDWAGLQKAVGKDNSDYVVRWFSDGETVDTSSADAFRNVIKDKVTKGFGDELERSSRGQKVLKKLDSLSDDALAQVEHAIFGKKASASRPRLAGTFTVQEWKTHKRRYPGAKAEDHTITKGDGGHGHGSVAVSIKEKLDSIRTDHLPTPGGMPLRTSDGVTPGQIKKEVGELMGALKDGPLNKEQLEQLEFSVGDLNAMSGKIHARVKKEEAINPKSSRYRNMKKTLDDFTALGRELGKLHRGLKSASTELRNRVIHLAYKNPELRGHLLPLLRDTP